MLRAFSLSIGLSIIATSALAATDVETCRDNQAEAAARLAACTAVTEDQKVIGKPKAFAHWYIGDSLLKKRDYDGALVALDKALELDPDNATVLNSRGLAHSNKGEEERALADFDLAIQRRPNFSAPYNNRGLIFLRRGELQRAYDEFNLALSLNSGAGRYTNLLNLGRVQTLRKQYESALTYFAEGRPLLPGGWQIPGYRCITYTEMGRLDEALADCNEVLARHPKFAGPLARRFARERLAALVAADPSLRSQTMGPVAPPAGKLTAPGAPSVSPTRKVALIVGNGAYRSVPRLDNPPRDARLVADTLRGAKHGETALDGDSLNSPFATALAREIKVPMVEVRRLFDIVRDDVWKATNRQQQPFIYGSLPGREDFYFVAEK